MAVVVVPRTYRIQKAGRSYYVAIPKVLVKKQMLENGVQIEVLKIEDDNITLRLKVAVVNVNREHAKDSEKS